MHCPPHRALSLGAPLSLCTACVSQVDTCPDSPDSPCYKEVLHGVFGSEFRSDTGRKKTLIDVMSSTGEWVSSAPQPPDEEERRRRLGIIYDGDGCEAVCEYDTPGYDYRQCVDCHDERAPVSCAAAKLQAWQTIVYVNGCSGTLIAKDVVITAAHCVYDVDREQWTAGPHTQCTMPHRAPPLGALLSRCAVCATQVDGAQG